MGLVLLHKSLSAMESVFDAFLISVVSALR
jgi:hypothetical protein